MTLKQLERFLVLAEVKNFHASAELLHITQPALSQSIQKLETSIGEPLFLRGGRGVELTDVGKLLVPRAKLILKFGDDFLREVAERQNRRRGHIRVGVAPYFARDFFPAAFARFSERRPDVLVDILEEQTLVLVRGLEEGELDLAFCGMNAQAEGRDDIEFESLFSERYALFARSGHPLFRFEPVPFARLADFPWAVHDRELSGRAFAPAFEALGLAPPCFRVATHSLQVIAAIVRSSDHVALMARDYARPEVDSGRIREIPQSAFAISTVGGVFRLRDAPVSPALAGLIDCLREVCRERAPAGD